MQNAAQTAKPGANKTAAAAAVAATLGAGATTTGADINIKEATTAAPALERKVQPIEESRIKSGDFVRAFYVATAFENTQPQDLEAPEYWAHFAQKLRLRDRIEVWANDGSWVADIVVLGATKNSADVRVLTVHMISGMRPSGGAAGELKSYSVAYRGIHSQWSVIRVADNEVVHEGEGSEAAANTWLTNHLKAFK